MAKIRVGAGLSAERPKTYENFITRSRRFVESKELLWELPTDEQGNVGKEIDWDLRILGESPARAAARLNGFAVQKNVRDCAIAAGWPITSLPIDSVLSFDVQEFLKAVVAYRCKEGIVPRSVRHEAHVYRQFFSATVKLPWDLNTEDFNRFIDLGLSFGKTRTVLGRLAKLMNEKFLSNHIPLDFTSGNENINGFSVSLADRAGGEKLPDPASLHELARIVFQEAPIGHHDRLRFCIVQLLIFTGLRLNEILMLPADCLRWGTHVDVVTGLPASEIGGIDRTLQLRYFGLKRGEGRPDVLVEDHQFIPEKFQKIVSDAVENALHATASLRQSLRHNHKSSRHFKTTTGLKLSIADLLFIVIKGRKGELPHVIRKDVLVETISEPSFYEFMGVTRREGRHNVFTEYGAALNREAMSLNPHSLRHLMNTEFFKLNIPDTIITQHFGRQSVIQSHVYDHRTLHEKLSFANLPPSAERVIVPGTAQEAVAKMIVAGFASSSHIAKSFKKIQAEHGDQAAFEFLATTSDGFHVTPYGFCTTSFAVNPCVRHLKCFDNCKQYIASGIPEHRVTLLQLRERLVAMRKTAIAKPVTSTGRKNQIEHADRLIAGVGAALDAQPNGIVFPGGSDHSYAKKDQFI